MYMYFIYIKVSVCQLLCGVKTLILEVFTIAKNITNRYMSKGKKGLGEKSSEHFFGYVNAENTCLSASDWGKKYTARSPVEGERCNSDICGREILACDATGNGKRLTCACLGSYKGIESSVWEKYGSCTNDANGNWCS
ncbi:hypothetical protein BJ944DRAFT_230985 [Cunninghamella echinulata]|nr:hypothetical protein BJ944DRAFT_230985 [Cunninghamella echinulata]